MKRVIEPIVIQVENLLIEVIIEVTPQGPEAVIVWVDGCQGKNGHPPSQPSRNPHAQKVPRGFIDQQRGEKRQGPHGSSLPSGVEVNVLVAAGTGLVASLLKHLVSIYIVEIIFC